MNSKIKKNTFKILIKIICFVFIFTLIYWPLEKIFLPYFDDDTHQATQFYKLEKDSVDVMMVGGSSVLRGFSSMKLWEEYGITAEIRGSTSALPFVSYLNIKEGLKYQSPKVVVVGINAMFGDFDLDEPNMEGAIRRAMDYRKLSLDKAEIMNTIVNNSEEQTWFSYILPLVRYHDRWKELSLDEIKLKLNEEKYSFFHGQRPRMDINYVESREGLMENTKGQEDDIAFNALSKEYYDKIIELCKGEDINLILVATPKEEWTYSKYEAIKKYADQNKVNYIDFNFDNILNECKVNWEKDFSDPGHLNVIGAEKVTIYLGEYIVENYKLKKNYSPNVIEERNEDLLKYKAFLKEGFGDSYF